MRIILCLDDNGGMTFNNRRQSRDRVLIDDIFATVGEGRLIIAPFSQKLLSDRTEAYTVDDDMLDNARCEDYCFIEDRGVSKHSSRVDEVVIYRWNRVYPADTYFDMDLNAGGFKLVKAYEFEGSSHEKITKEIYTR